MGDMVSTFSCLRSTSNEANTPPGNDIQVVVGECDSEDDESLVAHKSVSRLSSILIITDKDELARENLSENEGTCFHLS